MQTTTLARLMVALSALSAVSPCLALATEHTRSRARQASNCTDPATRPEWRTLPDETKAAYISSVKCLATKPSRIGLNSSLYDDFPWVHAQLNLDIHFVASFLPWHRWFVHLYEGALRDDCGYTGPMPYWDWTQDSGALPSSPVFSTSPTTGFGGSGEGAYWVPPTHINPLTACVVDGAFADFNVTYFLGPAQPHCLNRVLNNGTDDAENLYNWMGTQYTPALVANITDANPTFETFWPALENTPHGAIHSALGGDMIPQTSPNDPLFFLHHSQVDRLWWLWQQVDPEVRNVDYSGNRYYAPDDTPAALTDVMTWLGIGPNMTVSGAMTTVNNGLCYTYV